MANVKISELPSLATMTNAAEIPVVASGSTQQITGANLKTFFTGNVGFTGDAMYDLNGMIIENADLSHGATVALIIPSNGNTTAPVQLNNTYGNITLGTGPSGTVSNTWSFDTNGAVNLPYPGTVRGPNFNGVSNGFAQIQWVDSGNINIADPNNSQGPVNWAFVNENGFTVESNVNYGASNVAHTWSFDNLGETIFPLLNTARGDNPSGNIYGYTINIGDGQQEAVITTPDGGTNSTGQSSQRLVINPGKGQDGTSGEGGDIYLWAGRGGSGIPGDLTGGSGGDIKIRGGQGMNEGAGGYIRMEAGDSQNDIGQAGYIEIRGGQTSGGTPGYINIQGGYNSNGTGGAVTLAGGYGYGSQGGDINLNSGSGTTYGNVNIGIGATGWNFNNASEIRLPGGTGYISSSANTITIYSDAAETNGMLFYDTGAEVYSVGDFKIFTDNANTSYHWNFDGNGKLTLPNSVSGYSYIQSGSGIPINIQTNGTNIAQIQLNNASGIQFYTNDGAKGWLFNNSGNLTAPGNISAVGNITGGNVIASGSGGDVTLTGGNVVGARAVITTPTAYANLTPTAGARAFINDGNLVAAGGGSFGAQVSGGGANICPVWSDGTYWYIG